MNRPVMILKKFQNFMLKTFRKINKAALDFHNLQLILKEAWEIAFRNVKLYFFLADKMN
jgi:hypothetical protein